MHRAAFDRAGRREAANVRRWRFDCLVEAGYDRATAKLVAERVEIDLHAAVDLIRRGCPPRTAIRILS